MTRLFEILISLAIVLVLFVLVGFLLPSSRHLSESVETNRKLPIVFDTINSLRRFEDWNPLILRDPDVRMRVSGPAEGVGARLDYTSDEEGLGEGNWEIVESVPNKSVTYALVNPQRGTDKTVTYTLEPTGRNDRNVKITQTYDVDYGLNLIGRYAGLYVSRHVGDDMKLGLRRLSDMLATVPNYDYTLLPTEPKIVENAAENVLFVPSTVDRNNDVVRRQMLTNMEWLDKVMEANGLEAAGPLRVITTEFGAENYAFEIALPVREIGTGPEEDEEDADAAGDGEAAEGEEAAEQVAGEGEEAQAAPLVDAPQIEVEIDPADGNPVEFRRRPAGRAAMVPFTGHMAGLSVVRDGLRAWALTQDYEVAGRPYEEWLAGIEDSFTQEGEFKVYWPVKSSEEGSAQDQSVQTQAVPVASEQAGDEAESADQEPTEEESAEPAQ